MKHLFGRVVIQPPRVWSPANSLSGGGMASPFGFRLLPYV